LLDHFWQYIFSLTSPCGISLFLSLRTTGALFSDKYILTSIVRIASLA